jgi:2-furoyl-CoA dehydrogenase large subunit
VTDPAQGEVVVAASPDEIWAILDDPEALARVLPGAESVVPDGPHRVRAVLASRVGFLTMRADIVARFVDADRPRHVRLEIDGSARGMSGDLHASIPFDLTPQEGSGEVRTLVRYSVALEMTGRLRSMGGSVVRNQLPGQIRELVLNVEREVIRRRPAT